MSTTYKLHDELDITEQSSKFYISVKLPLGEYDLDNDWHHTSRMSVGEVEHLIIELAKVLSYNINGESSAALLRKLQDVL